MSMISFEQRLKNAVNVAKIELLRAQNLPLISFFTTHVDEGQVQADLLKLMNPYIGAFAPMSDRVPPDPFNFQEPKWNKLGPIMVTDNSRFTYLTQKIVKLRDQSGLVNTSFLGSAHAATCAFVSRNSRHRSAGFKTLPKQQGSQAFVWLAEGVDFEELVRWCIKDSLLIDIVNQ